MLDMAALLIEHRGQGLSQDLAAGFLAVERLASRARPTILRGPENERSGRWIAGPMVLSGSSS